MSNSCLRIPVHNEVIGVIRAWSQIHRRPINPYAQNDLSRQIANAMFIREDLEEIIPAWSVQNGLHLTDGQVKALIARLIQAATIEVEV